MRSASRFAVVPVVFICLVSGCAQPASAPVPDNLRAGYLLRGARCGSLDRLAAYPVGLGEDLTVKFGPRNYCLEVQPGINEPVQLLALPRSGSTYYVTVHTDMARMMLVPRIELLDGTRKELRVLTFKDMKSVGNGLNATFFVTPGEHRVDYILVYPDPALTGDIRKHLRQGLDVGYYGLYSLAYGTSRQASVTYVEQGALEVRTVIYHPPGLKRSDGTGFQQ